MLKQSFYRIVFGLLIFFINDYLFAQSLIQASGSSNNFIVSYPANLGGVIPDGMMFTFKANHSITGNATLDVNSIGAKPILKNYDQSLSANDIKSGHYVTVIYDASAGGSWQITSSSATSNGTSSQWTTSGPDIYFTGGNVGIGIANPLYSLDAQKIMARNRLTLSRNDASSPQLTKVWSLDNNTNDLRFFQEPNITTAGTAKMTLRDDGVLHLTNNILLQNGVTIGENSGNIYFGNGTPGSGSNNITLGNTSGGNGTGNIFMGQDAGASNNNGVSNIMIGQSAGLNNQDGSGNIYMGESGGVTATNGNFNVLLGQNTAGSLTDGSNNIFLGYEAGNGIVSGNHNLAIGTQTAFNNDVSNSAVIGRGSSVSASNQMVIGNGSGYEMDVGIATEPTARLDVNGSVRLRDLSGAGTRVVTADLNGNLSTSSAAYVTSFASSGSVPYMSSGTTLATSPLQYDGSIVRIGTLIHPAILFQVNGSTASNFAVIHGQNSGTDGVGVWGYSSNNSTGSIGVKGVAVGLGSAVYADNTNTSGYALFATGRGYFGGNVGIGITNPNASLSIARGSGTDGTAAFWGTTHVSYFNYQTNEETFIRGGKTGSKIWVNDSHNGDVSLVAGGGRVGIGVGISVPSALLHVKGTSPFAILDANAISQQSSMVFAEMGTTRWQIGKQTNNSFFIYDQANSRDVIQINTNSNIHLAPSAGNVAVGHNAPNAKLDVLGQMYSRAFNAGASTNIDWNNGNVQYTSVNPSAFTFTNMQDGGIYQLISTSNVSGTNTFSQAGLTFVFANPNGLTLSGQPTRYTFTRFGTTVYVEWQTIGSNYVAGQLQITGGAPGTGKVLTSDANGLGSWQTPPAPPLNMAVYLDQKTQGTAGDAGTNNAWTTRTLNTNQAVYGTAISRSGNTITLQPGKYRIQVQGAANCNGGGSNNNLLANKIRIYNITGGSVLLNNGGNYTYAHSGAGHFHNKWAQIDGLVDIVSATNIRIEHYVSYSASFSFGLAANITGEPETYLVCTIQKVE